MEAKEFRIGNFMLDEDNELCQICSLISEKHSEYEGYGNISGEEGDYKIEYPEKDGIWLTKVLNPIPLTEQWLLKLGFTKISEGNFSIGNSIITKIMWEDDEPEWKFKRILSSDIYYYKRSMLPIDNIHQLQNLYFALTGEELKIKQ